MMLPATQCAFCAERFPDSRNQNPAKTRTYVAAIGQTVCWACYHKPAAQMRLL